MSCLTQIFTEKWKRFVLRHRLWLAPARSHAVVLSLFFVLFGIWYLITLDGFIDPVFLPSPGRTFSSLANLLSSNFLFEHVLPSSGRVAVGFALSILVAFPLGVLTGQIPSVARVVHPLCGMARYLPVAALVPLSILWFGIHDGQKVAVIIIGVVFQLVLLIASDTASVPKELVETALTFGLSRRQILSRIVIPWSMPAIWDDLRISAGWAWSYVVLAELVAGNRGVGYFIVQSQRFLETDRAFAGIIVIAMLGFITDLAFRLSATRLFRWS